MKKATIQKAIKTVAFWIVCNWVFMIVTNISLGFDPKASAFFEEPRDTLDAVYIGASPVYSSWIAPVAWKKYGIAVWGFSNSSQPFVATLDLLKCARETQPNAVYLISINGIYNSDDLWVESLHSTTDPLPFSLKKIALINRLCTSFRRPFDDFAELLFPLFRYHSKWSSLSKSSFHKHDSIKGSRLEEDFLSETEDISTKYNETHEKEPLPEFTDALLDELLKYCEKENVKAVFVLSAQYRDEQTLKWYNTIKNKVQEYEFPFIDELADFDVIGLDDTKDFSNEYHTNIHGALKTTDYLSQYLLDHYDFPEKSGGGVRELGRILRQV